MGIQSERSDTRPVMPPERDPLRVLIVDDAASTRTFLRAVLDHCDEFDVVGEADDGDTAIDRAAVLQPDVVLLDISMPALSGAGALRGILEVAPTTMVIIVSGASRDLGQPLLDAGATAYVPKGIAPFDLLSRLGDIMGRTVSIDGLDPLTGFDGSGGRGRSSKDAPVPHAVVFVTDLLERQMIRRVIELCDLSVLAETENISTLRAVIETSRPEVAVIELPPGGPMDMSLLGELRRRSPGTALIVYADTEEWREAALIAGATAFVLKPRIDELVDQIQLFTSSV